MSPPSKLNCGREAIISVRAGGKGCVFLWAKLDRCHECPVYMALFEEKDLEDERKEVTQELASRWGELSLLQKIQLLRDGFAERKNAARMAKKAMFEAEADKARQLFPLHGDRW